MDEAEKLLREVEEDELLIVDERVYGVLVDGYCQMGRMDDAVRIRDEMLRVGLKMNMVI
ncbi:putative pentatricopeptide repeat-containing protein, partial [Trifolium medium]|nr:putative pentatricopeptide repeat-containing protein [Trifolium medium]